jgi:hypothetical protein
MAKIRLAETAADDYGFAGTHILDNGVLLSHIRLTVLDVRAYRGEISKLGVQVGRCGGGRAQAYRHSGCAKAWAWKRGSATLDEMRCPACGGPLQQTTLALQLPFYVVEPAAVRVIATDTLHKARDRQYRTLESARTDTEHSPEWRKMRASMCEAEIEKLTVRLRKVQKNPRRR